MQEVDRLFAVLAGDNAVLVTDFLGILWPVWLAGVALYGLAAVRHRGLILWPSLAILSGLMAVLPLAGFAVYFCLGAFTPAFSVYFSAMRTILPVQIIVRTALGLTLATWLMAGRLLDTDTICGGDR